MVSYTYAFRRGRLRLPLAITPRSLPGAEFVKTFLELAKFFESG